nr:protocadherin alpha-8-like [Chrysemys picta bellii]
MFRMVSNGRRDYFEVNLQNGVLFVNSRVDREELCGQSPLCAIDLEVIVDKPLRIFHVEVEIQDINDNAPVFPVNEELRLSESRTPDSRFPLEGASDGDIGTNSLLTYKLSSSEHFILDLQKNDEDSAFLVLVLKKPLDREETPMHRLLLTATDGGKPGLTGTVQLVITVLDVNDNAPVFNQSVYKTRLFENAANGTLVIKLNATDLDDGINKDIIYSIRGSATHSGSAVFSLLPDTGEIRVNGELDFEDTNLYEVRVQATDRGNPPMVGQCTILVEILDVNDNAPELAVTSLSLPVSEDDPPGTVVRSVGEQPLSSYISVHSESGHIYALQPFDYEELQVLQFQVSARDAGFPSLCGNVTVQLFVLDENDNAPAVSLAGSGRGSPGPELVPLSAGAGHVVGKIRAVDADSGYNAWLRYEVQEPRAAGPFRVGVYSGEISTTRALEEADGPSQRLVILVKDHGEPALSATATVSLSLVESPQAVKWDSRQRGRSEGPLVDMNVSLMIGICSVSGLFVLVIVVYVGLRCHPGPEVMCGSGKATVVCSSEVGSWSYSQRQSRNLCVGEGTAKNDLMVFSPNFPNSRENGEAGKGQLLTPNASGMELDTYFVMKNEDTYMLFVIPQFNKCD